MGEIRENFQDFQIPHEFFSFPRGLWLFYNIGFHATLLVHDGTTLLKGKASCTTRMGWGWPGMMLGQNVAMHIMTMVGVGDGSPLDVGDKSFELSNKGKPNKSNHSTRAHE